MIVVLCNSFEEAKDSFAKFMDFLEFYEPQSITRVFESSYCVDTDDDLRYVFVDYRFGPLFENLGDSDEIWEDEFFCGLYDYYFVKYVW